MLEIKSELVRPLRDAENVFLEVLLDGFELARRKEAPEGASLTVRFNQKSKAAWNRFGREAVREAIALAMGRALDEEVRKTQKAIDAILLGGAEAFLRPVGSSLIWRWASAGTLPVVSISGECSDGNILTESYYCLFYREIFPIGWNIANGACDNRHELLDPLQALERELGEELVVLDPKSRIRYVLQPEEQPALDRAEFANFRRLWSKQFKELDLLHFRIEGLACKWEQGPDEVSIESDYGKNILTNCFININAADFGIELDRIARIALPKNVVLCDGETTAERVLNRPVGLFEVQKVWERLDAGQDRFLPDRVFYSGREYEAAQFESFLSGEFATDVRSWRLGSEIDAFEQAENKLNLCPVTRSIILRHKRYFQVPQPPQSSTPRPSGYDGPKPQRPYDVFISFGEPDADTARKVFVYLKEHLGCSIFFAPAVLDQQRRFWSEPIDTALVSASAFVAVATAPENFSRGWVNYEIRAFHQLHCTEEHSTIVPLISGFEHCLLPMPLRAYQALSWKDLATFDEALRHLVTRIAGPSPPHP